MKKRIIECGDIYWVASEPALGRVMKNPHRYAVLTKKTINQFGIVLTVPITTIGNLARTAGFAVPITGYDTTGIAVCNQVRSFDLVAHIKAGTAKYIETLDQSLIEEIVDRVINILDPAELS